MLVDKIFSLFFSLPYPSQILPADKHRDKASDRWQARRGRRRPSTRRMSSGGAAETLDLGQSRARPLVIVRRGGGSILDMGNMRGTSESWRRSQWSPARPEDADRKPTVDDFTIGGALKRS
jgi:hypothetical protein